MIHIYRSKEQKKIFFEMNKELFEQALREKTKSPWKSESGKLVLALMRKKFRYNTEDDRKLYLSIMNAYIKTKIQ